jgi:hypothetical protein
LGRPCQVADSLDREDLPGYPREHRRLITRPCPNLEHTAISIELKQLGHSRDDEWLRDSLISGYRESMIAVSSALQGLWHKQVSWSGEHRIQSARVANSVMFAKPFHHPLAGNAKLSLRIPWLDWR